MHGKINGQLKGFLIRPPKLRNWKASVGIFVISCISVIAKCKNLIGKRELIENIESSCYSILDLKKFNPFVIDVVQKIFQCY